MLYAAADLTLTLAEGLLEEDRGLKDATPHNVLFRGSVPVFVDVLSFEPRTAGDPIWLASAQFVRTFLLPLMLNQELGTPLSQIFLSRRDGIDAAEAARSLSLFQRWRPPFLGLVTLPRLLSRFTRESAYQPRTAMDADTARFIVSRHFKNLRKLLRRFEPKTARSKWSSYADNCPSYTAEQRAIKNVFVAHALKTISARNVLDVGSNSGEHSFLAATSGASVVAIDSDEAVSGRLFTEARKRGVDILPLVVDFARPSPAVGWRCAEQRGFLDRASGSFDCVMMLAVLHHLLVTEQVPLSEVLSLASQLTRRWLIVEYVDPADPMFQKLTRGRAALHDWLTREVFLDEATRHFDIVESCDVPGSGRCLYLMELRRPAQ
jgi:SAM-dependent methyltransferase